MFVSLFFLVPRSPLGTPRPCIIARVTASAGSHMDVTFGARFPHELMHDFENSGGEARGRRGAGPRRAADGARGGSRDEGGVPGDLRGPSPQWVGLFGDVRELSADGKALWAA